MRIYNMWDSANATVFFDLLLANTYLEMVNGVVGGWAWVP